MSDDAKDPACCICDRPIACIQWCCSTDDGLPSMAHNECAKERREQQAVLDSVLWVEDQTNVVEVSQ